MREDCTTQMKEEIDQISSKSNESIKNLGNAFDQHCRQILQDSTTRAVFKQFKIDIQKEKERLKKSLRNTSYIQEICRKQGHIYGYLKPNKWYTAGYRGLLTFYKWNRDQITVSIEINGTVLKYNYMAYKMDTIGDIPINVEFTSVLPIPAKARFKVCSKMGGSALIAFWEW